MLKKDAKGVLKIRARLNTEFCSNQLKSGGGLRLENKVDTSSIGVGVRWGYTISYKKISGASSAKTFCNFFNDS